MYPCNIRPTSSARLQPNGARHERIRTNQPHPDVAPPDGAETSGWEDGEPAARVVHDNRRLEDESVSLFLHATQLADGSFDDGSVIEAPGVSVDLIAEGVVCETDIRLSVSG